MKVVYDFGVSGHFGSDKSYMKILNTAYTGGLNMNLCTRINMKVVYDLRVSGHFGSKTSCMKNGKNSQVFMLNILSHYMLPSHTKSIFTTSHQILLSTKLISKNWFYCFFLIFWQAPISPSCWMPCLFNKQCFF